jgi:putative transposase
MPTCPHCQKPNATRDGHDRHGRQRFTCTDCDRDFTTRSASAFSGYRWPADVMLMAVHRRPLGNAWYIDEMFFFPGTDKWYLYRAVDESGQVVDVLLRDTAIPTLPEHSSSSASAAQARSRVPSSPITISRTSRPSSTQSQQPCTFGAGFHRASGVTTKPIERSHIPTRDRLRSSRGLKTLRTGQRFLEGFEGLRALRGGHVQLTDVLPAFSASASRQDQVRTVAAAVLVLGMRLNRKPQTRR